MIVSSFICTSPATAAAATPASIAASIPAFTFRSLFISFFLLLASTMNVPRNGRRTRHGKTDACHRATQYGFQELHRRILYHNSPLPVSSMTVTDEGRSGVRRAARDPQRFADGTVQQKRVPSARAASVREGECASCALRPCRIPSAIYLHRLGFPDDLAVWGNPHVT